MKIKIEVDDKGPETNDCKRASRINASTCVTIASVINIKKLQKELAKSEINSTPLVMART